MVIESRMEGQAAEYLRQGKYGKAISLYEQFVEADTTVMSNYWYLGLAQLLAGEVTEAQAIWFCAIAQGTPEDMEQWLVELITILDSTAQRLLGERNLQLATEIYWQILELDANQYETHYNLGRVLAQQGNFDEAIACWQRAIELKPDFWPAFQNQGQVHQKLENFPEAITCYSQALDIKPDLTETYYNLGLCFLQQGSLDNAIASFQQEIELQPDLAAAYGDWGGALLQKGKLEEAIVCWQQAMKLQPSFARAYCHLRDNQVVHPERKAYACLLNSLQIAPVSAETYFYLGLALTKQSNLTVAQRQQGAIAAYQQAIRLRRESPLAYLELGKILAQTGNLDGAIAADQQAILLQPNSAVAKLELGKLLANKGDQIAAIAFYQQAVQLKPDLAEVWLYSGNALAKVGKWDEAIEYYQKQLQLQPGFVDAYCNLGIALAQVNQSNEAIRCFSKVMEINSDLALSLDQVMLNLCEQGKISKKTLELQGVLPVDVPQSCYELTKDWLANQSVKKTGLLGKNADISLSSSGETQFLRYSPIYPQNIIPLIPPRTPEEAIHFSFRFGNQIELPASFVAVIPEGRFWLNKKESASAVITADNQLLGDISPEFPILSPGHPDMHSSKHSVFSLGKLPPIQRVEGTVAILAGLLNDLYFHWMLDILPRIELLHQSGIEWGAIDYFLISSCLPFQQETLQALGIPKTKILETAEYPHLQATRLVVPSFPGTVAWMPPWVCNFLRRTFLDKCEAGTLNRQQPTGDKSMEIQTPPKELFPSASCLLPPALQKIERLYISRQSVANRLVINEKEVISFLEQFGFTSVSLESMSVRQQAALLAQAQVVVAPHGSGLTNTVFCSPGTKVIEIFSPNYVYHCYWL
ncbi:MAG: tetratricopeptide repeat protein, partial [Symploca sp. SIO2E6]|nr:tetratricopeptide repeat protein [Symploca sp. SIO2E6]